MYEPPAPDARPQQPGAAEHNGSPAAVWPPMQLWTDPPARPEQPPSEDAGSGRGQLSEQFWRRSGGQPEPTPGDGANVVPLPTSQASAPSAPELEPPEVRATGRTAALGEREHPLGPPPATSASLGMEDAPTGEFPRWGTGLVPPLEDVGEVPPGPAQELLSEPTLHRLGGPPAGPGERTAGPGDRTERPNGRGLRSMPPMMPLPAAPSGGAERTWTDPPPRRAVPDPEPVPPAERPRAQRTPATPAQFPGEVPGPPAKPVPDEPEGRVAPMRRLTDAPDRPPADRLSNGRASRSPDRPGDAAGASGATVEPPRDPAPPTGTPRQPPPARLSDPLTGPLPLVPQQPPLVPEGLMAGPTPSWLELMRMDARAQSAPTRSPRRIGTVPRQPEPDPAPHPPVAESPPAPEVTPAPETRQVPVAPLAPEAREVRQAPAPAPESEPRPVQPVPDGSGDSRPYREAVVRSSDGPEPADAVPEADAATVLTAVRELPGVRGAELVGEPGRQQVLRLDLVASVDPHVVGRQAAALLRDQLGVHAAVRARSESDPRNLPEPQRLGAEPPPDAPPRGRRRTDEADRDAGRYGAKPLDVSVEQVQVVTAGLEAAVEVGLAVAGVRVAGRASGPAHDWHVLRAAVTATTEALGMLLAGRARLALEYAELVPAGPARVAVVSLLLLSSAGTERVAGAAPVKGEAPDAAVLATIAAVRHRLTDLLDDAAIGRDT